MIINNEANELIEKLMTKHPNTLLTIGALKKGETTFKLFDKNGEIPYESHLYEMGSIGKTFTTSLLAKLISEGKMNLDDPVSKYIPELEAGKYYPTLKRLATHTAGYSENFNVEEDLKLSLKILWRNVILRKQQLLQDVYTMNKEKMIQLTKVAKLEDKDYSWVYSNFGMALLGQAISHVAGKDFISLMNEYMQQELQLSNTTVATNYDQLIQGYDVKNQAISPYIADAKEMFFPAGAGMFSTAEDLLEYARLNLKETPAYLALGHVYQAAGNEKSGGMDMALGWWLNTREKIWWHGGNTSGFATSLAFIKETDFAAVILANIQDYEERSPLGNEILLANGND